MEQPDRLIFGKTEEVRGKVDQALDQAGLSGCVYVESPAPGRILLVWQMRLRTKDSKMQGPSLKALAGFYVEWRGSRTVPDACAREFS